MNDLKTIPKPATPETVDPVDHYVYTPIPLETLIEYRNKKLTYQEIGELTGCSKQNVQQRLEAAGYCSEDLENYKKHRGDMFAFLQSKLLNSIDAQDIKDTPVYQRIISTGILYDKERLERGKSTSNINVVEVQGSIQDLQTQAQRLRDSL